MTYLALARKWRPKRFDQIVGQSHVIQSLTHALTHHKIHHAYLFTGTHGIGKTTFARIFAKCLNCEAGISATPCEKCSNCQEIDSGRFPDLYEIDAASRTKVEDTRELLDNIPYSPTKGKFKVYLIDEVHMLSGHSFNALLKILEEPPEHVKFLLATTDPQKLPVTVLSRCLQFHLSKMLAEQINHQLIFILESEKINFEPEALPLIAESANGSMRDSLSLLDQCISYGNGKIKTAEIQALLGLSNQAEIISLLKAICANDANTALALTKSWAENGVNFTRCLSELLTQLYRISVKQAIDKNFVSEFSRESVELYYRIGLIGQRDLPLAPTAQIGFEMIVIRMMGSTPALKGVAKTHHTTKSEVEPRASETSLNWNILLLKLNLTGPTLALAQQCALKSYANDLLHLTLHPKYAALLNPKQQQRIQGALTQHHNQNTKIKITIEENKMETPAESAARLQDAQKQSAKKAISADPTVQRIVKTFDASVIEDSIEST